MTPVPKIVRKRRKVGSDSTTKKLLIERDGDRCARCCKPGSEVHHIKTKGANRSLRHELNNLVYLCLDCHRWAHKEVWSGWKWVIANRPLQAEAVNLPAILELSIGNRNEAQSVALRGRDL